MSNPVSVQTTWTLSPYTTWRVAGLSADLLDALLFPRTLAAAQRAARLEVRAQEELRRVAEVLEAEVPLAQDDQVRRALINARRQVRAGGPVKTRDAEVLAGRWEAARWAEVQGAGEVLEAARAARTAVEEQLDGEYAGRQRSLRSLLDRSPDLLGALECVAPDLYATVQAYRRAGPGSVTQWRKLELSLFTYLTRAAFRTSPMSRLTFTAFMAQHTAGPLTGAFTAPRSEVQLQASVLIRLFGAVMEHPRLRGAQRFVLNPDLHRTGGQWRLFQRRQGQGGRQDRWVTLRDQPALERLVSGLTAAEPQPLPVIASALGVSLESALGWVEACLLRPEVTFTDDLDDPMGVLSSALDRSAAPLAREVQAGLRQLAEQVERYARDVAARPDARRVIRETLSALFARLEVAVTLPPESRLLVENATLTPLGGSVPFSSADGELEGLGRLLALFNLQQGRQLRQVAQFAARFGVGGACGEAAAFLRDTSQEWPDRADPYVAGLWENLNRVWDARDALLADLYARYRQSPGETLTVDGQALPRPLFPQALDLLLQPSGEGDDLVLNGAMAGQFNALCRVWRLLRGTAAFSDWVRERRGAQVVVSSQSSINMFPTLYGSAVFTPGTPAGTFAGRALRLHEVTLMHDAARHRLLLRAPSGELLEPQYVSTYHTGFLAPLDQAAVGLSVSGAAALPLASLLYAQLRSEGPVEPVTFVPRVRCGRTVVSRASWFLSDGAPWRRDPQETDLGYWERLAAAWEAAGLPRWFYALPADRQNPFAAQVTGPVKPQLFLMDSLFSVRSFGRWLESVEGTVLVQESLPGPGQGTVQVDGDARTCEFSVHLDVQEGAYEQ
ncbi:lantibiotic dehydratase [Deinococcus sp. UR1]|uniref:lantibiotic dehydratase n=1 Tax=Deinococcus sp. UR1 TaxID=1704277 RepID=UPI0011AF306C|nr:lantibiotic dehydratase [Deinococcus sp. UR1]